MRVKVGEQEREERELADLVARRVRRHHPSAAPEVEAAYGRVPERLTLDEGPPHALPNLDRSVEVPKHNDKQYAPGPGDHRRQRQAPQDGTGTLLALPLGQRD